MLRIEDVSYNEILKNISIKINKGDFISVSGPSGSGKTTLFRMLNNLISPTSGSIYYNDKNINDYDPVELRRVISLSPQTPLMFGKTTYDNLAYPFEIRRSQPDMDLMLKNMELLKLRDNILNENINNLSGGEKQRISLLRNIIFKPEVLLLDEITSALDIENSIIIEDFIKELNLSGVTILWITHSLEQLQRISKRHFRIENGRLKEV